MKLPYLQLTQHLSKNLAPIYFISGDELLLVQEAVDAIRQAASNAGFTERVSTIAEPQSDWKNLIYKDTHNLSLFATKKIVELNLRQIKLNNTHGKILEEYALKPLLNTLLIINTAKLEAKIEKAAWYQRLEKISIVIPIWPIAAEQLTPWILQRAKKINLQLTPQAAERLATLVEGNLLAAAQEIEKIALLYANKSVDHQVIENAVTDNARFDIFNLVDSALVGNSQRCLRILQNLAAEDTEPTLVLWALARELRLLADIQKQLQQGTPLTLLFSKARLWEKRQASIRSYLKRHTQTHSWKLLIHAAKIDRIIKGAEIGRVWDELQQLTLQIAGNATINL
jgi:DNA polymerase-3 subunit delta